MRNGADGPVSLFDGPRIAVLWFGYDGLVLIPFQGNTRFALAVSNNAPVAGAKESIILFIYPGEDIWLAMDKEHMVETSVFHVSAKVFSAAMQPV